MSNKGPTVQPLHTVLMSVRARRGEPESGLITLKLSQGPDGARDFRLSVWGTGGPRGMMGTVLADFKLKDVSYEQKSPKCHELLAPGLLGGTTEFFFEDEQEAQRWWTVLSSSLREAKKDLLNQESGSRFAPDKSLTSGNKNPFKSLSVDAQQVSVDFCTKEELGLQLSRAIECGDEEMAAQLAVTLTKQKVPLQIQLKPSCYPKTEICMKVGVEDASDSVNISLYVQPHTTIAALKQQIFREHQFHPSIQRWIIGQCLCLDDRTLASYGIKKDGDTAFLYLLSTKNSKLGQQDPYQSLNPPLSNASDLDKQRSYTLPTRSSAKQSVKPGTTHVNQGDVANKMNSPVQLVNLSSLVPAQAGWACSTCTFINKPTRPGCEMCSSDRPQGYIVPEEYKPDETEKRRLQGEQDSLQQYNKGKGRREKAICYNSAQNGSSLEDFTVLSTESM